MKRPNMAWGVFQHYVDRPVTDPVPHDTDPAAGNIDVKTLPENRCYPPVGGTLKYSCSQRPNSSCVNDLLSVSTKGAVVPNVPGVHWR